MPRKPRQRVYQEILKTPLTFDKFLYGHTTKGKIGKITFSLEGAEKADRRKPGKLFGKPMVMHRNYSLKGEVKPKVLFGKKGVLRKVHTKDGNYVVLFYPDRKQNK